MKKAIKALYIVLAVLVALVLLVVIAVNLFADSAVKKAVEIGGTKALKVDVSLAKANLSIMGGALGLKDLAIKNPPGYQHDTLLKLNSGDIKVVVGSLLSNQVRIKEIKLDGMNLVLEQKGLGSNLQEVIKGIPSGDSGKAEPSGKKLVIDNLEISNVTVQVKLLPVPGKADTMTLKLSTIKMKDLGSDSKLDVAALSSKILLAIADGIAEQGAGIIPKDMLDGIGSVLGKTLDVGKEVIKGTGEIGKGLGEGLKGLLKPKEKK
jgi:hypothetical protein